MKRALAATALALQFGGALPVLANDGPPPYTCRLHPLQERYEVRKGKVFAKPSDNAYIYELLSKAQDALLTQEEKYQLGMLNVALVGMEVGAENVAFLKRHKIMRAKDAACLAEAAAFFIADETARRAHDFNAKHDRYIAAIRAVVGRAGVAEADMAAMSLEDLLDRYQTLIVDVAFEGIRHTRLTEAEKESLPTILRGAPRLSQFVLARQALMEQPSR